MVVEEEDAEKDDEEGLWRWRCTFDAATPYFVYRSPTFPLSDPMYPPPSSRR